MTGLLTFEHFNKVVEGYLRLSEFGIARELKRNTQKIINRNVILSEGQWIIHTVS